MYIMKFNLMYLRKKHIKMSNFNNFMIMSRQKFQFYSYKRVLQMLQFQFHDLLCKLSNYLVDQSIKDINFNNFSNFNFNNRQIFLMHKSKQGLFMNLHQFLYRHDMLSSQKHFKCKKNIYLNSFSIGFKFHHRTDPQYTCNLLQIYHLCITCNYLIFQSILSI